MEGVIEMKLHFNGTRLKWRYGCQSGVIAADCQVRNEIFDDPRDERPLHVPKQVVYAETGNRYERIPYMPHRFPEGIWNIGTPREKPPEDEYLWPYYIPTDAWQIVNEWVLDTTGGYSRPTTRFVVDTGYGIHYHPGRTTLGCIHVIKEQDLRNLVLMIFREQRAGHKNIIEVRYED